MSYENHKYNNHVIEVLDLEHGKKVIEWWKSQGVDTKRYLGTDTKENNDLYRFYGLIHGKFEKFSKNYCFGLYDVHIITLPDENVNNMFSVGQVVKFKNCYDNITVLKFTACDVPENLLLHGTTILSENKGLIECILPNNRVAVSYIDKNKNKVCLSFNVDDIEPYDNKNIINNSSNIKTEQNGKSISVQKVTPTIQSGIRIGGSPTSGRRSKTSTSIGHLSNQKIVGH